MDNKSLLLLIILFIIIFIIIIIIFIVNNKNQTIEKFASKNNIFASYMNYPRILLQNSSDRYNSIISYFPSDATKIIPGGLNLSEKYDITASSSLNNLGINGYGTYYINSTFYINNPSDRNCISSSFNNRNLVTLISANNNYDNIISIVYPERFQFKGIEIMLNSDAKNILENKIMLYGLFNSSPSMINTTVNFNNNVITLSIVNINDIVIFDNTLYIIFDKKVNRLEILSIKIFGEPYNTITTTSIIQNTTGALNNRDISIFTDNKFEVLPNIYTNIQYAINNNEDNKNYERTITDKFKYLLINNRPPWGMYNAKNVSDNTLNDVFNRECKKANIEGGYEIIKENVGRNNANITYLKGTTATTITFPIGSLPEKYTICLMSKYTNLNTNRSRILTAKYPRNWLLGHWGNRKNGVMYNDNWIYYNNDIDNTNDWRISCVKSNATNYSYSYIINNINIASTNANGNFDNSAVLKINGWPDEKSDFGLAYLIIWDVVLTDSELLLASQALTNYSITGEELNINSVKITENNYGTSRYNPGNSALDIKLKTCTNINGEYWIKNPITGNADKVYCIMDSECYGGGWMLAIKGTNKSGIFSFDGVEHELNGRNKNGQLNKINHWETNSTVQKDEPFNLDIDAKYDIFNHFKVTECLAIFNSSDTGGVVNKPNYGWTWHEPKFYNGNLSLRDFFATYRSQFTYYSSSDYDFVAGYNNNNNEPSKKYDPAYITRVFAANKDNFNQTIMEQKYTSKIWSRQDGFRSFGFNIIPINYVTHKVRWGGIFNNEGDVNTSDVGGGIGLNNNWNAGNYHTCCESDPRASLKQMGFKWFIK